MLTPELVRARVKKGELVLTRWSSATQDRAELLADEYLMLARQHLGATREELKQHWSLVPVMPAERRLADGLLKLVEDACDFGSEVELTPAELRREVFLAASLRRREATPEAPFSRGEVLEAVAEARGVPSERIEEALYADLKGAQRLRRVDDIDRQALVARYQLGQLQAVLLRAVEVVAEIRCESPLAYRQLFNKLKFRRLLCRIEASDRGYRVHMDGPFSLFESVTKYGLQLALVLPALLECDELDLHARLSWGKQRHPVDFRLEHRGSGPRADAGPLADDVEALRVGLSSRTSAWRVSVCTEILNLPGLGVCVPDLTFRKAGSEPVYLEVLGYWSRDAVWRRVAMAEKGLGARVLFAVSSRLRVSETVLGDSEHAALYVYKGVMSPAQVLRRVEALAERR